MVCVRFSFNPIVRYQKPKLFSKDRHLIEPYLVFHIGRYSKTRNSQQRRLRVSCPVKLIAEGIGPTAPRNRQTLFPQCRMFAYMNLTTDRRSFLAYFSSL